MPDDVIVPKDVEHRIRALHPPEHHEAELENARGFYRTLREDRRQELRAMREPDPIRLIPAGPSPAQEVRIKAHKERKKKWRRKPRKIKYPVNTYPAGYPAEITGSEGVIKSEIMPGVFKPITRMAYGGGREAEPAVRAAVASRVRGDLVYHGGTKARVKKLVRRGTAETEKGTGFGQAKGSGKGLVFTTPSRSVAQGYAVAGRTEKTFGQHGDLDMNKRIVARGKGAIGSFNMKGQWPRAVYHGSNGPELLYTPKQLQQGRLTVQGQKPHRTQQYKLQQRSQELRDRERLRARALHAKGVPVAPGDRQGERYRRFLEEGDPLHTKAEESDIARRAMLRGEKTPKQLREEEFDRVFGKSYEDDLRSQAQARLERANWVKRHPQILEHHQRISALSADEMKAKVSAGRKKVDPNKILKPIRMDEGTVPLPEKKRRLYRLIHRKKDQIGKSGGKALLRLA